MSTVAYVLNDDTGALFSGKTCAYFISHGLYRQSRLTEKQTQVREMNFPIERNKGIQELCHLHRMTLGTWSSLPRPHFSSPRMDQFWLP
jgi:hypothetical protein